MYRCTKDSDIELFLKEKALRFERKSKSRTFLIVNAETLNVRRVDLLAYFTIAIQTLKIPKGISANKIKKLDGLFSKRGSDLISEIPAFLIGQLGKNDLFSTEINGDEIINYAFSILFRVRELIGGRVVFVECRDNPDLIGFYENNGFEVFRQDPDDKLLQMIRLLA
jgi:hypothetical protein